MIWYIQISLLIIAGLCKAIMDTLQFHFETSIFKNITSANPKESWKNKWKNGDKAQGEKFFLSSSLFVCFTDAWHFLQMIYINSLIIALCLCMGFNLYSMVLYLLVKIIFGLSFEIPFKLFSK